MKQTYTALFLLISISAWTQEKQDTSKVTIGAYADGYYAWYDNAKEVALQQHNCIGAYHNNFGLNIAQFTGAYEGDRMRGVTTIHFGDIPQITWANQYRNIQEANAGVRIWKKLWLDIGFFKTHVGTESFLPKDNLMSIITLGTYYGPFYQSGARLSYDTESSWHFELHAINGYNLHVDNNNFKTFGALISKDFGKKVRVSYSNMYGEEQTGLLQDNKLLYQNLYLNYSSDKLDVQAGVDGAARNNPFFTNQYSFEIIAALLTVKYHVNQRIAIAVRYELFNDPLAVNSYQLRPVNYNSGDQNRINGTLTLHGGTISVEYKPSEFGFLRIESRTLYDVNPSSNFYPTGYSASESGLNPMLRNRTSVMLTAGFYFDKTFKFAR